MKEQKYSYSQRIGKTTFIVNVKQSESAKKPLNKNISVLSYSQFLSFIKFDCWAFTLEHPVTADFQYIKKSLSREYNGNGYLSIPRLFLRALIRSCRSFSLASFSARSCASLKEKSCFTFSVKSLATSGKCSNA